MTKVVVNEVAIRRAIATVINALRGSGARRVTKYMSPTLTVRATHPLYKRTNDLRSGTILLKIGRPNVAERKFIKSCKKAGEPFPVKKLRITFPRSAR